MSEYLKRRFPLDDTSTVYMSGRAVYNLVRRDKPGIISSVELFPVDANKFRQAVRDAMADVWDEAVAWHAEHVQQIKAWRATGGHYTPDHEDDYNPYRDKADA